MARMITEERMAERGLGRTDAVVAELARRARPLRTDQDLDPLIARIGDARYVLLGEATHGTSEFYAWRARLSRRLIRERGFRFVAVEGDWPDCQRVDRYVRRRPGPGASAVEVLHAFDRWPTWMWANREVADFAEWLRAHNADLPPDRRAGFHGLDVYSLWDSMRAVVAYLDRVDPAAGRAARRAYECFAPYREDAQRYGWATLLVPASCEDAVVRTLADLRRRAAAYAAADPDGYLDAEQNARVAQNAETYYRAMVGGGAASWNVRDGHMVETLEGLMERYGRGASSPARAIVWAHNTHVGDARYTDMAGRGEFNLGQVVRERHADDGVVLVGFSTWRGAVIAGDEWDAPMRRMEVPPARPGSVEDALHRVGAGDALVLLGDDAATPPLLERRGHRAVGVVYHPAYERLGNYVPTVLPRRYDALLHVDVTTPVTPLHMPPLAPEAEPPETYPSGM